MGNSCFHKRHSRNISLKLSVGSSRSIQNEGFPEAFSQGKQIQWKLGELLAEGRFCKVHQCIDMKSGELLVLKSYPTSRSSSNFIQEVKKIKKEAAILKTLEHRNVIGLCQIETSSESLDLLMECIPGGCLEEILSKYGALEEEIVKNYLKQLVEVLVYLSSMNISHNNLFSHNVYITSSGTVKLSGFKNFTYYSGSTELVTSKILDNHQFLAPEALTGTVCKNSDIWSLGLLVIHMITGKQPLGYLAKDSNGIMKVLASGNFDLVFPKCSENFLNFLKACLKLNQLERPSINDLLHFDLFTGKKTSRSDPLGDESMKASLSRTADCQMAIPEISFK